MGKIAFKSRANSPGSKASPRLARWAMFLFLALAAPGGQVGIQGAVAEGALNGDRIYELTQVWTVHLKFEPAQWEAMEPKGGGGFFGGPRGGPGGSGNSPAGRLLAPVWMSKGDTNRDGRLSTEEMSGLAQQWFRAWDTNRAGKLDEPLIRAGLDKLPGTGMGGMTMMLLGPEGKRNGLSAAMGVDFESVHADLEFGSLHLTNVAVRYKGNGTFMESRQSLKRSLKVETDKYVPGQSLGGVKVLTLQNNVTDASLMNEVLAYRLYRDAGVPAPRTAYARVFVTVPGKHEKKYLGLYSLSEAVDKTFAEHHFKTKGGALFKPVTSSLFSDLGADWAAYQQMYDPKGNITAEQKKAVMDLARFVTQSADEEFAARIGSFVNLGELARFMAVMVYLSDLDGILGPGQNLFLHWHPQDRLFRFIPWDQDHSWGQFNRASQEQRDRLSIHRPWTGENAFLERMFKVSAFKTNYLARLEEFGRTLFQPARIAKQVDEVAAVIREAVREESADKLARFEKAVAGESLPASGPFGGGSIKPIKPFAQVRAESVLAQVTGKAEGLTAGGGFQFGPGGSRLGAMFGRSLLQLLDENKDGSLTASEFEQGFSKLYRAWHHNTQDGLNWAELRAGLEKDLTPSRDGFPGFGGGPPRGRGQ